MGSLAQSYGLAVTISCGIAVGAGATIATNRANEAVDFVRTNSSVVVAVLVVVLAGRFF